MLAEPYTPVSEGVTGWSSDRALEIDATIEGHADIVCGTPSAQPSLEQDLRSRASELGANGTPLFLERALVSYEVGPALLEGATCTLPYRAHVSSFASFEEIVARSGRPGAYRRSPFRHVDPSALRERPPYRAYVADGELTIGAVFGQMDTDDLSDDDDGFWSMAVFEEHWIELGFDCRRRFGSRGTCEGTVNDTPVRVTYIGPELFPVRACALGKESLLEELIRSSDILYINGHAFQGGLQPLYEPGAYPEQQPRLVMLDLCWASLWMLPDLRRSLAGRWVDIVASPRRVVTGSVESITKLSDRVVSREDPSWGALMRELNVAAQARADERRELVDASLRDRRFTVWFGFGRSK